MTFPIVAWVFSWVYVGKQEDVSTPYTITLIHVIRQQTLIIIDPKAMHNTCIRPNKLHDKLLRIFVKIKSHVGLNTYFVLYSRCAYLFIQRRAVSLELSS